MGSEVFVVKTLEGGICGSNLIRTKSHPGPKIQGKVFYVGPEGLEVLAMG